MKIFSVILLILFLTFSVSANNRIVLGFCNDDIEFQDIDLGNIQEGSNRFSASISNNSDQPKFLVIDIRTECIALGRSGWQSQFFYQLYPNEKREIAIVYHLASPILDRMILRLGKTERYFNRKEWNKLPAAYRKSNPPPKPKFIWKKTIRIKLSDRIRAFSQELTKNYGVFVNSISSERLLYIKKELPELIRQSRVKKNLLRNKLKKLFLDKRNMLPDFDPQISTWAKNVSYIWDSMERFGIKADVFSINGEGENRIKAFFATLKVNSEKKKPMILLLSGNPPGTKESLVKAAIYFSLLGYHTVGIDRRESARLLDSKKKFLTNYSDPVFDALRLIDYFESNPDYKFSKIGIFGFSAGAGEARFISALDDRVNAVVIASGTTSFNWLFKNRGWIPTLSGMIIYPDLGLGSPAIGKLSSKEFWKYFYKAKPEHNALAKEKFSEIYPFFNNLDPLNVMPLVAPIPSLIISGAQDGQFTPSGVVEVDIKSQSAYKDMNVSECSEFYLQPRTAHSLSNKAACIIVTFFDRWLK